MRILKTNLPLAVFVLKYVYCLSHSRSSANIGNIIIICPHSQILPITRTFNMPLKGMDLTTLIIYTANGTQSALGTCTRQMKQSQGIMGAAARELRS